MTEQTRHRTIADNPGSSVAVGTTSTLVAAANPDRYEIHITNDSDTTIYLRLAATGAVTGSGIRLNAAGGSFSSAAYGGAVSAIHAGVGAKSIIVCEV